MTKDEELKELWKAVAIAVAGSDNETDPHTMAKWANRAVEDYKKFLEKL